MPYEHGILDDRIYPLDLLAPEAYIELLPRGIGFERWGTFGRQARATDATLHRSPALWEILDRHTQAGFRRMWKLAIEE